MLEFEISAKPTRLKESLSKPTKKTNPFPSEEAEVCSFVSV